jgi:hypothetical protein
MARVLLGGKMILTLREETTIGITEALTVSVTSGRIQIKVDHNRMRPGERVEVVTPNAVAEITGTILVTEVVRDDPCDNGSGTVVSTFSVLSGRVQVAPSDPASGVANVWVGPTEAITIGGCDTDGRPRPIAPPVPRRLAKEKARELASAFAFPLKR